MEIPYEGLSMRPFFKSGDLVSCDIFDQPKPAICLQQGSVYLIKDKSEWVLHRCILHKGKLRLKGDWSSHIHDADLVWGVAQSKSKIIDKAVAHISCLNASSVRLLRYISKSILILISVFYRP